MKVIDVFGFRKSTKKSKCRGWCNVVLDVGGAEFVVTGCAVIDGANGTYVALPSRQKNDGKYVNIAYFRDSDDRDEFTSQVLAKLKDSDDDDLPF